MSEGLDGSGSSWSSSNSVPEYVASLYYKYGLFVATHPVKVILFAICSSLLLSTPLWYLPFPGYLPQDYVTSLQNYSVPPPAPELEGLIQLSPSPTPTPLWYQGPPRAYIQQVVVRSSVVPWHEGISVGESVRGPLFSVFRLAQIIGDFQLKSNMNLTLGSECLLVDGVVGQKVSDKFSLPHYNCLMLSPADLWGRDPQAFISDQDVLRTVKSSKAKYDEETSIADILFGLPSKDIGLSASPTHPQVISFAITVALKQYSEEFISGLEEYLTKKFSLHQSVDPRRQFVTHVYFPSRISFWEFLIIIFYCILFASIYFSVSKMEGLHSRFGLAVSFMVSLIASLCIATSVCAHFGLRPLHSKGKYFYPVLAALVGFENSMALVRSVLSSPDHLDVKIRVAKGLAKEGWTVTKYFLSMITFVTISFFLFIPLVQEICIYGSLVLLCDLYYQLVFITSVISLDLHRCQDTESHQRPTYFNPLFRYRSSPAQEGMRLLNHDSVNESFVPNLHRRHTSAVSRGEDILAPMQSKPHPKENIPKRLRVTYYVVKMRFFQRMIMCGFVAFIAWMLYTSEILDHFTDPLYGKVGVQTDLSSLIVSITNRSAAQTNLSKTESATEDQITAMPIGNSPIEDITFSVPTLLNSEQSYDQYKKEAKHLKHRKRSFVRRLPISHWPALFSYYNISLRGHYLSILPPILLSIPIDPEDAKSCHNPRDPHSAQWIPSRLDEDSNYDWQDESAIIPSSRGELLVTAVLLIPALVVMVYATIALYRCICSRNYAEWRSSRWGQDNNYQRKTSQIIGEAVPLVLAGHPHDIECLCTDGSIIVSSCLGGVICAWDPTTGECLATIRRCGQQKSNLSSDEKSQFSSTEFQHGALPECVTPSDHLESDITGMMEDQCEEVSRPPLALSQSFPSLSSMLPDLSPTINLQFKDLPPAAQDRMSSSPFQFNQIDRAYRDFNDRRFLSNEKRCNNYTYALSSSYSNKYATNCNAKCRHVRNLSTGSIPPQNSVPLFPSKLERSLSYKSDFMSQDFTTSPVWALECQDGFVYVGTGIGTLELWDVYSSLLKCCHDDGSGVGITSLKVSGNRIVAARLNGSVDILVIETANDTLGKSCSSNSSPPASMEMNSKSEGWTFNLEDKLRIVRLTLVKAHQQPITVLTCDGSRIITGSHDHTLKVFSLIDGSRLFILHGHFGPVTSVALGGALTSEGSDPSSIGISVDSSSVGAVIASGAQEGSLCVWDIHTGTCVYSVQAHDGSVVTLTCTSSYILSLGSDDKLCIWERFQGHLLNTLRMRQMYSSSMVALTNKLLITSQQGSLTVWDISVGAPVRIVRLGDRDESVFIRHLLPVAGSIVCNYGNQLRVVRLPVAEKID